MVLNNKRLKTMLLQNVIRRRPIVALLICLILIVLLNFYQFSRKSKPDPSAEIKVNLPYVVVHIDLKGAPPKLQYLKKLFVISKHYGVNGLLMEYEDMFPYEGDIGNLSAVNHYSKHELKEFLTAASKNGFEIIPLIQTFGHMEHALKLPEYKPLREDLLHPDTICPKRLQSRILIRKMLTQVIEFHQSIAPLKHIHIGCDEVHNLKTCDICRRLSANNLTIYLQHVQTVSSMVQDLSPGITVLIWDDMLQSMTRTQPQILNTIPLKNVEPVYWDYRPSFRFRHNTLYNYHRYFQKIWIASAFKGADGSTATLPNVKHRFENHLTWMNQIAGFKFGGEKRQFDFKGIILTGWSRYSHMDPICELLPSAMPSLVLNLLLIKKFKTGAPRNLDALKFYDDYIKHTLTKVLLCEKSIELETFALTSCNFESIELYNTLEVYLAVSDKLMTSLQNDKSWLSSVEYFAQRDCLNMNNVAEYLMWCDITMDDLKLLNLTMYRSMEPYFENDTINEYVGSKLYNGVVRLQNIMKHLKDYMLVKSWDRRGEGNTSVYENALFNLKFRKGNQ